jgi:hypothetical protein
VIVFSKGDVEKRNVSFCLRPEAAVRLSHQEGSNRHTAEFNRVLFYQRNIGYSAKFQKEQRSLFIIN